LPECNQSFASKFVQTFPLPKSKGADAPSAQGWSNATKEKSILAAASLGWRNIPTLIAVIGWQTAPKFQRAADESHQKQGKKPEAASVAAKNFCKSQSARAAISGLYHMTILQDDWGKIRQEKVCSEAAKGVALLIKK
jgi:hypothetical protein